MDCESKSEFVPVRFHECLPMTPQTFRGTFDVMKTEFESQNALAKPSPILYYAPAPMAQCEETGIMYFHYLQMP